MALDEVSNAKIHGIAKEAISLRLFCLETYWGSELGTPDAVRNDAGVVLIFNAIGSDTCLMKAFRDIPVMPVPCRALGTDDEDVSCVLLV